MGLNMKPNVKNRVDPAVERAVLDFAFRTARAGKRDPGCSGWGVSGTSFGNRLLRFLFRDLHLRNSRSGVSSREVPDGEFAPGCSGFGFAFRGVPGGWFGNGGSGFRAGV